MVTFLNKGMMNLFAHTGDEKFIPDSFPVDELYLPYIETEVHELLHCSQCVDLRNSFCRLGALTGSCLSDPLR